MYDTQTRVAMVVRRVNLLHRKRENRLAAMLSMLCLMLTVSLTGAIGALGGRSQGYVPGLYGATMLFEDAGGYVLVGVLAFVAAVVITVRCIRYWEKGKKTGKQYGNKVPIHPRRALSVPLSGSQGTSRRKKTTMLR